MRGRSSQADDIERVRRQLERRFGAPATALAEAPARLAADNRRITVLRERLADLSWFMRRLNGRIARRANREAATPSEIELAP